MQSMSANKQQTASLTLGRYGYCIIDIHSILFVLLFLCKHILVSLNTLAAASFGRSCRVFRNALFFPMMQGAEIQLLNCAAAETCEGHCTENGPLVKVQVLQRCRLRTDA